MRSSVGIFQAGWPLQSQTANCALMLARAGYEVDLFLQDVPIYYDLLSSPENHPGYRIHFHRFGSTVPQQHLPLYLQRDKNPMEKILSLTARILRLIWADFGWKPPLIEEDTLRQSIKLIHEKMFCCFIGVEKKGVIWAGMMGHQFRIPYIYYSLELYTKDHPDAMVTPMDRCIKAAEESYHRKASGTVVQDSDRAHVLFADNGVPPGITFHLPVSVLGPPRPKGSNFFRDRYGLSPSQRVILQFGLFYNRRFSLELIDVAEGFNKDRILILHGYSISESYHHLLRKKTHDRVILSRDLVPTERITDVIASTDIGLVLYTAETQNDFLTAFASEKLALFLQHGKPIIAFDYPGYRQLIAECECGVLIQSLSELPEAIEKILSNWDHFKRNAIQSFRLHYDYAINSEPMIDWINRGCPPEQDQITGVRS